MAQSVRHKVISIGLIFYLLIKTTISFPEIHSVTVYKNGEWLESQGSTEGGTLIWIRGNGFAQDGFSTLPTVATKYRVELTKDYVAYNCKIHPEEVTNSRLTCYTSAMPPDNYVVRIYEDGILIPINLSTYPYPSHTIFTTDVDHTPIINSITPITGSPQRMIYLSGDFKSNCYSRDTLECSGEKTSFISRVYIGGQLCNLINSTTNFPYSNVSHYNLQCLFESNEVGIFNVTVIVTNGYGRSATNSSLYRVSGTGQPYTFQTYANVSEISPRNGSLEGGTLLTINGQYFSNSNRYPLMVNVGNEPCTILNMNLTTIQCQTKKTSTGNRRHFHGGRGFHIFSESVFIDLANGSVPMPSTNATQTWTEEASFHSSFISNQTVWLIGYLRSPINATYRFQLNTNINTNLYLSTNEDPNNRVQIANSSSTLSKQINLINNQNYYMLCIGSTVGGSFNLSIQAKMSETKFTVVNNVGTQEIQSITVGSSTVREHQRIIYSQDAVVQGTSEIQDILVINEQFQIGFRGVYTYSLEESPEPEKVEEALNNLATIYPFEVIVELVQSSYRIRFPADMGDVPSLTIISSVYSIPKNATEIVKGISTGSYLAFELDGLTTKYVDIRPGNLNGTILQNAFDELFSIRCPPTLNNPQMDPSIVYVEEFEQNYQYNENIPLSDVVFCNRGAYSINNRMNLVQRNSYAAEYICFAYKLRVNTTLILSFFVESDEDSSTQTNESISMSDYVISDNHWHYTCIQLSTMLENHNRDYYLVYSFIIIDVLVASNATNVLIDTVTLRGSLPLGYEYANTIDSFDNNCIFPFWYKNKQYYECTLDQNNLPICRSSANQTVYCQSSSIEGVRRLFPKYELVNNQLSVTYDQVNRSIDIQFRYTDCQSSSLVKTFPSTSVNVTSITKASQPVNGYYDIIFNNQSYSSIPAKISASDFTDLLQSFENFGFVNVIRSGECGQYFYTIEWLSKGDQPTIIISNLINITSINVSTVRNGNDGSVFYDLPQDLMRTYHTQPQVEVVVGGYSSYCSRTNNSCQFQFVIEQTPNVTSIRQNGLNLTIDGNGFSSSTESNLVLIGEQGSCFVTVSTSNMIECTINNAPAGIQLVRVNVIEKGFASMSTTLTVTVPLQVTSFSPIEGAIGGGYPMTINGIGFSSDTKVYIGEQLCTDTQLINYSFVICTVPSSLIPSLNQVKVSVIANTLSTNASTLFTYNSSNPSVIVSLVPNVVDLNDQLLSIRGTGFPLNDSLSVFVGTKSATVRSILTSDIEILLPKLAPGRYPVRVQTSLGFIQSNHYIEYRFYIERISPKIGSFYGGSDVYVYGGGFDNLTNVNFYDQNRTNVYPCDVKEILSDRILCQTRSFSKEIQITANGTHPLYGVGFAWSPYRLTIEQGTNVIWTWDSSDLFPDRFYRVYQVENSRSTEPFIDGFNSGVATLVGSFSYQFRQLGTFYYYTPPISTLNNVFMRGIIDVMPMKEEELQVEVIRTNFLAQTCVFPFTYDSVNYTACTSTNDTRSWCSPTSIYSGQRLYCTVSSLNRTCPIESINATISTSSTVFLPTLHTIDSITNITPLNGSAGTLLTIFGNGLNGNLCEYEVTIGSSYRCPITNKTSTEIICQITNGSMLDATKKELVRVNRIGQGYIKSNDEFRFQFIATIYRISPTIGSAVGGTQVTIEGDGFIASRTQIFIGLDNYTPLATITYSRIVFTTLSSTPVDYDLPIYVRVGSNQVNCCVSSSCTFQLSQNVTPSLNSVSPSRINAPTNLTLTGENLLDNSTHIIINNHSCSIIQMTNQTINCLLNDVEMGNHIIQGSIDGIGNMISSLTIIVEAVVLNSTPEVSSIYGGNILTINGFGFLRSTNLTQVMIGTEECFIIRSTTYQIQCIIPPQNPNHQFVAIGVIVNNSRLTSSLYLNYSNAQTPIVDSVDVIRDNNSIILCINGSHFDNENNTNVKVGDVFCSIRTFSSTSITCQLSGNHLGAGQYSIVVQINGIGNSNSNVTYTHDLVVSNISPSQGSFGGGLLVNIYGNGLNTSNISVLICNRTCQSLTIVSNNQLSCLTPYISTSEVNGSCNVTVTVGDMNENTLFTYMDNLTATVLSINPPRGGTGGGTLLTITGTQFPNSTDQVTVRVGNVLCSIETINSTTIRCRTGRYNETYVNTSVTVLINGSGYAIGSFQFQYINLWSSRWTWGGDEPPEADTIVSIEGGATVFVDISPPTLKALVIENATLIFDDSQDLELTVEYIIIANGGHLQIGTESSPHQHRATITLNGYFMSTELPIFGAKVLAVRDGILDLHGQPSVQTWTKLAMTALNGSSIITVQDAVNWSINNEIVIATTGDRLSQKESEVRRIMNISSNGLTLTLDKPLEYTHLGQTRQVNRTTIEIRAEVGLLSHNIVVRGSTDRLLDPSIGQCPQGYIPDEFAAQTCALSHYGEQLGSDQFGATIMISRDPGNNNTDDPQRTIVRLSHVEFSNVGQSFRLNRYPINFYRNGNMNMSYVKSCSIYHSFNRGINIQGSHYLTIEQNVFYNIMSGAVILPDGIEIGNNLRENLVVLSRASSNLECDDLTPAAFWLRNPNNIVEHNAAVGCTHYGYWYQLLDTPSGLSFYGNENYHPYKQPFGRFYNNSVHSTGLYGLRIYPRYIPTMYSDDRPSVALFEGFIAWQNNIGLEWTMSQRIQVKNALLFDNMHTGISCMNFNEVGELNPPYLRPTFYNVENGTVIIDSIIIGNSDNTNEILMPSRAGLTVIYDRGLLVQNVTFINFLSNQTVAIAEPTDYLNNLWKGWLTKFSKISFINVALRGKFHSPFESLYEDTDGTLTDQNHSLIIMPPNGLTNSSSPCSPSLLFENAVQCNVSEGSWVRVLLQERSYLCSFYFINSLQVQNELNHSTYASSIDINCRRFFVMTLQVNKTYTFSLDNSDDWFPIQYSASVYDLAPNDYLIFQHKMSPKSYGDLPNRQNARISASINNNGDWFYDNETMLFSYIIKNPGNNNLKTDVQVGIIGLRTCPYCSNCGCPPTTTGVYIVPTSTSSPECSSIIRRHWSMDSSWNRMKPVDNEDIIIPSCNWFIIDCPLPIIRSLRIDGILEFEDGMNHRMSADSIIITDKSKLIAGGIDSPFNGTIDIILTNNLPTIEQKLITVTGQLALHGSSHMTTWTRLSQTAFAGSNLLILSTIVDWQVNDEIIITTTDTSVSHTERHQIAAIVNSTTIRIGGVLSYTHRVIEHSFPNGKQVHIAAAVGLLTRNIRVISQYPSSDLSGLKILISKSPTDSSSKGSARLSNVQFIGFGRFVDSLESDQQSGIYMDSLGYQNPSRPTYITNCSFDGGYNGAIGMLNTHGIVITNNIFYNTYRTAIVVAGKSNTVVNNLVSTIYWSGSAQSPSIAQFNFNYDGAITSRNALITTMTGNLVAGVERIAYRIQGNGCPLTNPLPDANNIYANNEAHSAMAGVSIWPSDKGFRADRECVYIKGFTVYKGWYYGFYINTARNITMDSCVTIDSQVGIFTFVIGPSAVTHVALPSRVTIQNSMIIGSITASDCADVVVKSSLNVQNAELAMPTVAFDPIGNRIRGRVGIVFPTFSGKNQMPNRPWTGISTYPCLDGTMIVKSTTIAFFNEVCDRNDVAFQVSQSNDDGQFPMITSSISRYNISNSSLFFNGLPNVNKVNPKDCGNMDCDGLKKILFIDTDGTLFSKITTVFSQAEKLWGDVIHNIGDFRFPLILRYNIYGEKINISSRYPYRGISRSPSCSLESKWGMYACPNVSDYRMLIIESMDSTSERQRLSPVAILSDSGYIDLLNGPQAHSTCTTSQCTLRLSTFMALVQSNQTYRIYFTGLTPNQTRFRLINADESISCVIVLYFNSVQQIDVYANSEYISPTNRDTRYPTTLILKDERNNVTMSSSSGANYFDRKERLMYFKMNGNTVIDVKLSPLFVLTFGLPPMEADEIYRDDIATKLAYIFNFDPVKIRRVKIVPVSNSSDSRRRRRRNIEPVLLTLEVRDEPRRTSTGSDGIRGEVLINIASRMINSYQSGELSIVWKEANLTNGSVPISLRVQEPFNHTNVSLSIINRTELRIAPSQCREQSPCGIQPVLVAYDSDGKIIEKLGSNDQPWQVKAMIVGQTNVTIVGDSADYVDGQTRFTRFSLSNLGPYEIQFSFIQPDGVQSSFFQSINLTVEPTSIEVTKAIIDGQQVDTISIVNASEKFDISMILIDKLTRLPLSQVQWSNWSWNANITIHNLPKYNRQGKLNRTNSISPNIDLSAKKITIPNLKIDSTGMFIVDIRLVSTNDEHVITLPSNGILVKTANNEEEFLSDINDLSSNLTFSGDYDALQASNQLEEKRAMIYNYLLDIGMPLISDIVLIKGSVVALFQVNSLANNISQAVSTILDNAHAIPDLTISSVNINGRSYTNFTRSTSLSSSSSSNDSSNNTALIAGVTVGLIAALCLVFVGVYFYRVRKGNSSVVHHLDENINNVLSTDNHPNEQHTDDDENINNALSTDNHPNEQHTDDDENINDVLSTDNHPNEQDTDDDENISNVLSTDNHPNEQDTDDDETNSPPILFPTIYQPPQLTPAPLLKYPRHIPATSEIYLIDLQEYPQRENMNKVLNEMVYGDSD